MIQSIGGRGNERAPPKRHEVFQRDLTGEYFSIRRYPLISIIAFLKVLCRISLSLE